MKKAFAAIVILTISIVQVVYAGDTNRRTLAEELLTIMDFQKNIETSFEMMKKCK